MVLHAPVRLQLAAVLAKVSEAEFARLREIAGVSDSVLSKHLSALAEAGYVTVRRGARDGRARGWASLTSAGKLALESHIAALRAIIEGQTVDPPERM